MDKKLSYKKRFGLISASIGALGIGFHLLLGTLEIAWLLSGSVLVFVGVLFWIFG